MLPMLGRKESPISDPRRVAFNAGGTPAPHPAKMAPGGGAAPGANFNQMPQRPFRSTLNPQSPIRPFSDIGIPGMHNSTGIPVGL